MLVAYAFLSYLAQLGATVVLYVWGQLAWLGLPVQHYRNLRAANLAIVDCLGWLNDFFM